MNPNPKLSVKAILLLIATCISGAITAYMIINTIVGIGSEAVLADSVKGSGFLFAIYTGTAAWAFSLLTRFLLSKYTSKYDSESKRSTRPLLIVAVVLAGIAYAVPLLTFNIQQGDSDIGANMMQKHNTIQVYAKSHNNTLPTSDAMTIYDEHITYRVIDHKNSTFELCGKFATDTTKDYSEETAQKISTGQIVTVEDDYQVFFTHIKGEQCYKLKAGTINPR